ncbi:MAG: antifreeze protein [Pseudomonadota bacterium]
MANPAFLVNLQVSKGWFDLALACWRMNQAATEVIVRRSVMMSRGRMDRGEAMGMVTEKYVAAAAGLGQASVQVALGARPDVIVGAALSPVQRKTQANARRLRR